MIAKFLIIFASFQLSLSNNSEYQCGLTRRGLISNGDKVGKNEFPWKVALFDDQNRYFCGGVLIDENLIATAAHCIHPKGEEKKKPEDILVVLGAHNLSDSQHEPDRKEFKVKNIQLHRTWNPTLKDLKYTGDLALVELTENVTYSSTIVPVCIATGNMENVTDAKAVGWGITESSGRQHSDIPRKVDIPIVDRFECLLRDPNLVLIAWTDSICAGKPKAGACSGDSGSGLFIVHKDVTYLRGIVSSSVARDCSDANLALYTDIIKYQEFLRPHGNHFSLESDCKSEILPSFSWQEFRIEVLECQIQIPSADSRDNVIEEILFQSSSSNPNRNEDKILKIEFRPNRVSSFPKFDKKLLRNEEFEKVKFLKIHEWEKNVNLGDSLRRESFENLSQLKGIFIHNCGLDRLPEDSFYDLPNLEKLWLERNLIDKLEENLLVNAPKLQEFAVYLNFITEVPSKLFKNNPELLRVSFNFNQLKSVPEDLLINLRKLERFWVNENQIESISEKLFRNNLELKEIWLYKNRIQSMGLDLKKLVKLRDIRVWDNPCITQNLYVDACDSGFESCFSKMQREIDEKCK